MLHFIALSARPVTLDEVAEYAIVEEGLVLVTSEHRFADCNDVLQLCGNLVSVQDNILSLAHKSVKAFLLSADVTGRPANDYEDYEVEIGRTCLTYLAFLERLRKSYPFLEYAAAMWPHHLRRWSRQIVLQDLIRSSLNLLGQATLWQTWLILQPADIWDNQIQLAVFVSDAVIRSPDLPGWALEFWDIRQNLRKKDPSRSPNSYHSFAKSSLSGAKSTRSSYHLGVQPSASRFFTAVRGKQAYTLAVLLLEIALQKSLESITAQEARLGSTYDTLDRHLQFLHEKSQKAQSRMGQKYGDVIRDCIKLASLGTENLPGVAGPVFRRPETTDPLGKVLPAATTPCKGWLCKGPRFQCRALNRS
jgi:hypothetical protein